MFVEELLARERDELEVLGKISERLHCPKCHSKTILRKAVGNDVMWACTHYPLCDGKLDAHVNVVVGMPFIAEDSREM